MNIMQITDSAKSAALAFLDLLPLPVQIFLIIISATAVGFLLGVLPFIIIGKFFAREAWERVGKAFDDT